MIPDKLDGWNLDAVLGLLRMGIEEDERFDWKEMVPPATDDAGKARLKDTLSAFANGDGGFVVVGVKDSRALTPEERVVGINRLDVEMGRLNSYTHACDPPVRWLQKILPVAHLPGRSVLVVHVPASNRRPHRVVEKDRSSFPVRGQGANRQMTMTELRAQFADQSRRRRVLAFALSEVERIGAHGKELSLILQSKSLGRDMVERGMDWWMTRYEPASLASVFPEVVEMLDASAMQQLHLLVRDGRASDRIAAEFVAVRTRVGLQNLVPADGPTRLLLTENGVRLHTTAQLVAKALRGLLE